MKITNMAATLLNVTKPIAIVGLLTLMAGSAMAGGKPGAEAPKCSDMMANSCSLTFALLCTATADADSLKARDRNGLVSKVLGAAIKLNQGKTPDADQKLQNYEDKLDALDAPKAKISDEDADALSEALIPARSCVDKL